jgi:hypothetical protein
LRGFIESTPDEREKIVWKYGRYLKMSGMVTMNWKKYHFFLLRAPAGVVWYKKYPFDDVPEKDELATASRDDDGYVCQISRLRWRT